MEPLARKERGFLLLVACAIFAQTFSAVEGQKRAQLDAILNSLNRIEACLSTTCSKPCTCVDIQQQGHVTSGIYTVYYLEGNVWIPVRVYCDMETAGGGWLVFQRRQDGTENVYRNWADYNNGFGDLNNEFWLGNHHLHMLTNTCGKQKLRIDLEDFENQQRYAEYSSFSIADQSNLFRSSVSGFSGDAGNSL